MEDLMGTWVAEQAFTGHLNAVFINTGEEFEVIKIEGAEYTVPVLCMAPVKSCTICPGTLVVIQRFAGKYVKIKPEIGVWGEILRMHNGN